MNRRTLARALAHHTLEVMPAERRPYALGMIAEVEHIEGDGAALAFALGALWASYRAGAGVWANWLRLGRWSVSAGTAGLGVVIVGFVALVLQRLPDAVQPPALFNGLTVLIGLAHVGAGWCLARRKGRAFAALVGLMAAAVTTSSLSFAAGAEPALPVDFYIALMRGSSPSPQAYHAALLLEQLVFVAALAGWGALFQRLERRAPA